MNKSEIKFASTQSEKLAAIEILNYYRNRYYAEPQVTERGIVANAINDILPNMVEVVRCKDCKHRYTMSSGHSFCRENFPLGKYDDDFCSYGERKDNG